MKLTFTEVRKTSYVSFLGGEMILWMYGDRYNNYFIMAKMGHEYYAARGVRCTDANRIFESIDGEHETLLLGQLRDNGFVHVPWIVGFFTTLWL